MQSGTLITLTVVTRKQEVQEKSIATRWWPGLLGCSRPWSDQPAAWNEETE
jgi:hypothetical protein